MMDFKVGNRVKLKYDAGDLRQPINVDDLGTVQDLKFNEPGWFWVLWDGQDEAMTMRWEELEKSNI